MKRKIVRNTNVVKQRQMRNKMRKAGFLTKSPVKKKLIKAEDKPKKVDNHMKTIKAKNNRKATAKITFKGTKVPIPKYQELKLPEWFQSTEKAQISVIVPMFRSAEVIKEQIKKWDTSEKVEIIYVDDACPSLSYQTVLSTWESRKNELRNKVGKIILNESNGGFASACNIGAKHATGDYLIFLNADCLPDRNWVKPLLDCIQETNAGIVGPLLTKNNNVESLGSEWDGNTFTHTGKQRLAGMSLNKPLKVNEIPELFRERRKVQMVTGACFIMTKKLFHQLNGFDVNFQIGYWEDTDLNMRVQLAGYDVYCEPKSKVEHLLGHSHMGNHQFVRNNQKLFYSKWVDSDLLKIVTKPTNKVIPPSDIVIYTAITNNYDELKENQIQDDIQHVAFLENPKESGIWENREVFKEFKEPNRNAKIHKVLSHVYFPEKEYSLWIDGSITLNCSIKKIIETYMGENDMLIFKHPERSCLYKEAEVCIKHKLDNPDLIVRQVLKYRNEGYPEDNGLCEATILLRRHTERTKEFNELWWKEIKKGSKRDQISFNYVAHRVGLKYGYFYGCLRRNRENTTLLFSKDDHKGKR